MIRFPKIDGLYVRDPANPSRVTSEHRHPVYSQIKGWWIEEKLDGTGCRIIIHPDERLRCDVRGRGEASNLSKPLRDALEATAYRAHDTEEWEVLHATAAAGNESICIYGEGIGPGIQSNPHHLESVAFVAFDVKFGAHPERGWAPPEEVHRIAEGLNMPSAPILHRNETLARGESYARHGFGSQVPGMLYGHDLISERPPAEGVVLKLRAPMYDARGRLIRLKLKPSNVPTGNRA